MKTSFLLLLSLVFVTVAHAQDIKLPVDTTEHQIDYKETVTTKGLPKELLYDRVHEWFARNFSSADCDVRLDDFEAGKIIVKSFVPYNKGGVYYHVFYTIALYIKPGRYRYEINDFELQSNEMDEKKSVSAMYLSADDLKDDGTHKGKNMALYQKINDTVTNTSASLKKALSRPAAPENDF